ncbi:MAG: GerMN domain-containing protein [Bacillota bacterium]
MGKTIMNLLLVFIICITATGMPLNINASKYNFKMPIPIKFSKEKKASSGTITYTIEGNLKTLENPMTVNFKVSSPEPTDFHLGSEDPLTIEIMQDQQQVAVLESKQFVKSTELPKEPVTEVTYPLDLSQENLNLSEGSYIFKVYSNHKDFKNVEPYELSVTYHKQLPYIAAKNTLPKGTMALMLYFPENTHHTYLIPITRTVPYSTTPIRLTIDGLRSGSQIIENTQVPIPATRKLRVSNDLVTVDFTSFTWNRQDKEAGQQIVDSMVQSLTSIPGINKVKFLINGKDSDNLFGTVSTRAVYTKTTQPQAYLSFNQNGERQLLAPVAITSQDGSQAVQTLFQVLQTGEINGSKIQGFTPILPNTIQLIDFSYEGNGIILNMSREFLDITAKRTNIQRMILDAILYTFTSLQGVDQVKIVVENNPAPAVGGIDLTNFMKKPAYINPEKE